MFVVFVRMNDKDIVEFLFRIGDRVNLKIYFEEIKNKKRKLKLFFFKMLC